MKCICKRDGNEHWQPPYIGQRALDDLILCLAFDVCSQLFLKYLHLKLKIENGCSSEFRFIHVKSKIFFSMLK